MTTKSPRIRRWKRGDLARLPDDGNRYEVLDGQLLVTPPPSYSHQRSAAELMFALHPYCIQNGVGEIVGPGAVIWDDNELQPDAQLVPGMNYPRDVEWTALPLPVLIVEILSDSTRRRDFGVKREAYLKLDIAHYWVVDGDARSVTMWTPEIAEPTTVTDVIRWQPNPKVAPLEIRLETILGA